VYYETACKYVNVTEIVYAAQLRRLLTKLRNDDAGELKLVEEGFRAA
jgi:hypothetical protein